MKPFTLFTTDVMGEMKPKRVHDDGRYTAIPATGGAQTQEKRHSSAAVRFKRACQDAVLEAKVDRAVELMARLTARRPQPVQAQVPGPADLAAQWREDYTAQEAQICAEAKAAYDARNPHKRKRPWHEAV